MQPKGKEVDRPPGRVGGHDAGQQTREEHPEHKTRDDDRQRCGAAMRRGKITDERQHELRSDCAHSSQERQRNEGGKGGGQAKTEPERCGEEDEGEDEGTAPDDVAEGTEEEETGGVAGLHDGGDEGDAFIGDGEFSGEHGEDGVVVVEICYSEGCCLGSVSCVSIENREYCL